MASSPSCPPKESSRLHSVPPRESPSQSLARSLEEGRMVEDRVEGGRHRKGGHEKPPHLHHLTVSCWVLSMLGVMCLWSSLWLLLF